MQVCYMHCMAYENYVYTPIHRIFENDQKQLSPPVQNFARISLADGETLGNFTFWISFFAHTKDYDQTAQL